MRPIFTEAELAELRRIDRQIEREYAMETRRAGRRPGKQPSLFPAQQEEIRLRKGNGETPVQIARAMKITPSQVNNYYYPKGNPT